MGRVHGQHRRGEALREAVDAGVSYLRKYEAIRRDLRATVFYKRGNVEAKLLMRHPAVGVQLLGTMAARLRRLADVVEDVSF